MAYNSQVPWAQSQQRPAGVQNFPQQQTQYPGGQPGGGQNPYGGGAPGAPSYGGQGNNPYGGAPAGYNQGPGHQQQPYGGQSQGYNQGQPYGQQGQGQPYGQQQQRSGYPYPSQGGGGGGHQQQNMPPPGVSQELWTWFQAVDQDRSGQITSAELQKALMNGNWKPFNPETCRLMIGMFDKDHSGTINVQEFSALWKYITDWKRCFDGFDQDRSGTINTNELQNAFRNFGYNLSPQFSQLCIRQFDRDKKGSINFDDFIQCCVMLHSMTESFKKKDTQRNGVIQLRYEEYLELVFENTLARLK